MQFVIAALLCAGSIAAAQGWEGGLKSGVSQAGQTLSGEFDWRYAPTSAVFVKRSMTRALSIQPELVYVRRTGVSSLAGSTLTMTADNVELPVLLNLHVPFLNGIAPYLSVGPSFAFRLRCRLQFLGGGLRTNDDCEGGGARSRRVDLGVAGGAGIGWTIGEMTILTEARATTGLRTYVLPADVGDARNVSWSVLGGVSMPLSRRRTLPPVRLPPLAALPIDAASRMRPSTAAPATPAALRPATTGQRITITADDVDVHEVIEGIAKATGFKVIVASQVRVRVTAALFDVTPEEAIQAIAAVTGLSVLRPAAPGGTTLVVRNGAQQAAKTTKP